MYKSIILYIILLYSSMLKGSDEISKEYIDSRTYQLYLDAKWDELIDLGKIARKENIDFYYLQLRLGTAYFYKKNYRQAALYFEMSLNQNPDYEYALEMLYYCYLYTGDLMNLNHLTQSISGSLINKITKENLKPSLNRISANFALIPEISDENTTLNKGKHAENVLNNNIIEDRLQYKNQLYLSLGSSFFVHKNVNISLNYSWLELNNTKEINSLFFNISQSSLKTTQNQFYFKSDFSMSKRFEITGAFSYLGIKSDISSVFFNYNLNESVNYYEYDTIIEAVDVHVDVYDTLYGIDDVSFNNYRYTSDSKDYSVYMGCKYKLNFLDISAGLGYSEFFSSKHIQGNLETIIYPKGNLNTYFVTGITLVNHQYDLKSDPIYDIIFNGTIGQKISSSLWFEAFYYNGNMKDATFNNGSLIYNSINQINEKLGLTLIVPLKKMSFYINYQLLKKEDTGIKYTVLENEPYNAEGNTVYISRWLEEIGNTGNFREVSQRDEYPYAIEQSANQTEYSIYNFKFNHHSISGGISWKF